MRIWYRFRGSRQRAVGRRKNKATVIDLRCLLVVPLPLLPSALCLQTTAFPPRLACQSLIRLHVSLPRSPDDFLAQCRRRRRFVPRLLLQPIADELLIEARLIPSRRILIRRPKSTAIRRQNLIDQNHPPI